MSTDLAGARLRLAGATIAIALLAPATARAEASPPGGGQPPWRSPHDRGVELFSRGDFEEAAASFEEARGLGAPAANLYNLARTYEQLERFADALRAYDEYLAQEAIPAERRVRAEARRAGLATLPAEVRLESEPAGATVTVDGEPSVPPRTTPTTIALPPGEHLLVLELEGHGRAERRVDLPPAGETSLRVTLSPLDLAPPRLPAAEAAPVEPAPVVERGGPFRGGPWVLLGVGLAVAAVGVALDITAWDRADVAEPFGSTREYQDWYDGVGALALAGDLLLGAGLAAGVAGLIWWLVERPRAGLAEPER